MDVESNDNDTCYTEGLKKSIAHALQDSQSNLNWFRKVKEKRPVQILWCLGDGIEVGISIKRNLHSLKFEISTGAKNFKNFSSTHPGWGIKRKRSSRLESCQVRHWKWSNAQYLKDGKKKVEVNHCRSGLNDTWVISYYLKIDCCTLNMCTVYPRTTFLNLGTTDLGGQMILCCEGPLWDVKMHSGPLPTSCHKNPHSCDD